MEYHTKNKSYNIRKIIIRKINIIYVFVYYTEYISKEYIIYIDIYVSV